MKSIRIWSSFDFCSTFPVIFVIHLAIHFPMKKVASAKMMFVLQGMMWVSMNEGFR